MRGVTTWSASRRRILSGRTPRRRGPFAAVNAGATRGFRARVRTEPLVVALAWGAAALLGAILMDWPARLLVGIVSTWMYLSVAALDVAAARALHINLEERGPEDPWTQGPRIRTPVRDD